MTRLVAALLIALTAPLVRAERLPADAGRLDVSAFGAIPGDGLPDTAAIVAAIQAMPNKDATVYLPCGAWDADDSILWKTAAGAWTARITLEGERADCATLRLLPGSAGFQDPSAPKGFISTGSLNASGVEAFQNNILDLTIDCRGNPGARCVEFLANNQGSMRDVRVLGDGPACVYLGKAYPGPALLERVRTEGCARGFQMSHPQYSITFLDSEAVGYSVAGLDVAGNAAFAEGFHASSSSGVPITSASGAGYLVLLGSELECGDPARSAIEVHQGATYLLRDVSTRGCVSALKDGSDVVPGAAISELASATFGDGLTLNLPAPRPPESFRSDDPSAWANVLNYGAGNGVGGETADDVAGIQAAMNSGRPVVYYPRRSSGDFGRYTFRGGSVSIPPSVRRVLMLGNQHNIVSAAYQDPAACLYRIDEGTAADPPLEIEYFRRAGGTTVDPGRYFCVTSRRRVVLRRMTSILVTASGPGELYALDVIGSFRLFGGRRFYAWQHNSEGTTPPGTTIAEGLGTQVRVVGMKTERDYQALLCASGAQCELLGGFYMPCVGTAGAPVSSVGWESVDASMSVSGMQYCGGTLSPDAKTFPNAVVRTVGGITEVLPSSSLVTTGSNRRALPLYSAGNSCHTEP